MGPSRTSDSRRLRRRPSCWVASCRIAGREVSGTVLDITLQGAFFCPDDGQPLTVASDQIVIIQFESEPALAGIEMPCRVRWIGYSDRHGRHGFGLEFSGGHDPSRAG